METMGDRTRSNRPYRHCVQDPYIQSQQELNIERGYRCVPAKKWFIKGKVGVYMRFIYLEGISII